MRFPSDDDYNDGFDVLDTLTSLLGGMQPGKKIARTKIDNFIVSTVVTVDMGPETAVKDSTDEWFVLQRYETQEGATAGHKVWSKFVRDGHREITALGYMSFPNKKVTLKD